VIGGVLRGMSSLLKASSLLPLQVLSCFSLAWSLSHLPKQLVLGLRLDGYRPWGF
jgi:hypothetical protein